MLLTVAASIPAMVSADPQVTAVSDRFVNGMYVVDATARFDLTDDMRSALNNGIPLTYDIEVEIYQQREWLWDELVERSVQRVVLEYRALSGTYTIRNLTTRSSESFHSLDEALEKLGNLGGLVISEQQHLPKPGPYSGRIRLSLDIQSLPSPLRPIAYVSPDWPLHSDWHEWTVTP
ncbi:MAG: DUF4390 domain-containing protein [Gammaproteobacteria bacterium]